MHVAVRPAKPDDGTLLVRLLETVYHRGYSATFDRDGALQPHDLWWVQSEKDVAVIEVDRRPAGLLVVGRGRQWLVEEVLVEGFGALPPRQQQTLLQRLAAHLADRFARGRQDALLLRVAETNTFGLHLAHHLHAKFTNALLVYRYRGTKRPSAHPPEGYTVRRSTAADLRAAARLVREVVDDRGRAGELERVLAAREARGYLAFREAFPVGFATFDLRSGRGDWFVGVRESHRRRGVGRSLAAAALGAAHERHPYPMATAWALDHVVGPFLQRLGFAVERTYLYVERPL